MPSTPDRLPALFGYDLLSRRKGDPSEIARVATTTNTAPMTYMHKGKQYVVLSVADPDVPAEHVALALPE
jgi:glucose dehydrogenase